MKSAGFLFAATCLLFSQPQIFAGQRPAVSVEIITTFAYPRHGALDETSFGLSSNGSVASTFWHDSHAVGFVRSAAGDFTAPLIFPGSFVYSTVCTAVNSSGLAAGYFDDTTTAHGFFFQNQIYTQYDTPFSTETFIFGLNDAGDFVGIAGSSPFISVGGVATTFFIPGVSGGIARGISSLDEVVGDYGSGIPPIVHGFARTADGHLHYPLDFPGSNNTRLTGVNARGTIVGYWYDSASVGHGLALLSENNFTAIDVPGATQTFLSGINDADQVAGTYVSSDGSSTEFIGRLARAADSSGR